MALGIASTQANGMLDGLLKNTSYASGFSTIYMQLHTGDPGSAGTSNVAGNTTRQSSTFGSASGGSSANAGAFTWTNVSTSETYTRFSLWSASTSGTFLGSGTMTANAVTAGDTFTVAISGCTVSLSVAA